jgi:hypothetical protein
VGWRASPPSRYGYPIARLVLRATVLPGAQYTHTHTHTCIRHKLRVSSSRIRNRGTANTRRLEASAFLYLREVQHERTLLLIHVKSMGTGVPPGDTDVTSAGVAQLIRRLGYSWITEDSWFDSRQSRMCFHSSVPFARISDLPARITAPFSGVNWPQRHAGHDQGEDCVE